MVPRPGNVKDISDQCGLFGPEVLDGRHLADLAAAGVAVTASTGDVGSTVSSTGRPGRTIRRDALQWSARPPAMEPDERARLRPGNDDPEREGQLTCRYEDTIAPVTLAPNDFKQLHLSMTRSLRTRGTCHDRAGRSVTAQIHWLTSHTVSNPRRR